MPDDRREDALRRYHRRMDRFVPPVRDDDLMTVDELLDAAQRQGAGREVPAPGAPEREDDER